MALAVTSNVLPSDIWARAVKPWVRPSGTFAVPGVTTTPVRTGTQAAQVPPQSTPSSPPFCTPSTQVAAWHLPLTQKVEAQSAPVLQLSPASQPLQLGPPQSVAVSLPLRTPS